jgi:hypothetical protein
MTEFVGRPYTGPRMSCALVVFAASASTLRIAGFEGAPIRR